MSLALPTAALATSIEFQTGDLVSGTISESLASSIDVTLVGSTDTITIDTGTLLQLSAGDCNGNGIPRAMCYKFNGGTVSVKSGGSTVFSDSLGGGFLISTPNGTVQIISGLASSGTIGPSSTLEATFAFSGTTLSSGTAAVSEVVVPEPGTLGLLGTGLIGLAAMTRRKHNCTS